MYFTTIRSLRHIYTRVFLPCENSWKTWRVANTSEIERRDANFRRPTARKQWHILCVTQIKQLRFVNTLTRAPTVSFVSQLPFHCHTELMYSKPYIGFSQALRGVHRAECHSKCIASMCTLQGVSFKYSLSVLRKHTRNGLRLWGSIDVTVRDN